MKRKVLVIDDESSIREALIKVLYEEGYEVVSAGNGQEAIEKFGQEKIDLLLLDLGLPAKDGLGMLEWLAQVNPLLPIIIITGRYEQREVAEAAGVDALMEKPLDVPRLLHTIGELMDESLELRAQRARGRTSGFRYVPCDDGHFLQKLGERLTTLYTCLEPKDTLHHDIEPDRHGEFGCGHTSQSIGRPRRENAALRRGNPSLLLKVTKISVQPGEVPP